MLFCFTLSIKEKQAALFYPDTERKSLYQFASFSGFALLSCFQFLFHITVKYMLHKICHNVCLKMGKLWREWASQPSLWSSAGCKVIIVKTTFYIFFWLWPRQGPFGSELLHEKTEETLVLICLVMISKKWFGVSPKHLISPKRTSWKEKLKCLISKVLNIALFSENIFNVNNYFFVLGSRNSLFILENNFGPKKVTGFFKSYISENLSDLTYQEISPNYFRSGYSKQAH